MCWIWGLIGAAVIQAGIIWLGMVANWGARKRSFAGVDRTSEGQMAENTSDIVKRLREFSSLKLVQDAADALEDLEGRNLINRNAVEHQKRKVLALEAENESLRTALAAARGATGDLSSSRV